MLNRINAVLTGAPLIVRGATRLISALRENGRADENSGQSSQTGRETPDEGTEAGNTPETLDALRREIERLNQALEHNRAASIEQATLIEELARHNATLANSLKQTLQRQLLVICSLIVILVANVIMLFVFFR